MSEPFDPEGATLGAVLNLPPQAAGELLDLFRDGDLADPRHQLIASVARALAADGIAPDPIAIAAHARSTGLVTRPEPLRGLALLLADLYAACPTPASGRYYVAATLEDALRRRCTEAGQRIEQAADAESLASLVALVAAEAQGVRELTERHAAALGEASPARLRAVGS